MVWWRRLGRRKRVGPGWYRARNRIGVCLRWDGIIAAQIRGRRSGYFVFGSPRALDCTCHAAEAPCPHAGAVSSELAENPDRFIDFRRVIQALPEGPSLDLAAIERVLLTHPAPILQAVEQNALASLPAIIAQTQIHSLYSSD